MKFATVSALFLATCGHLALTGNLLADNRGRGPMGAGMGIARSMGNGGSFKQSPAPAGGFSGRVSQGFKAPGGVMQNHVNQNTITNNIGKFPVKSPVQVAPRLQGLKPPIKVIDPGIGNGTVIKKPIDIGIGNGKPPQLDPGFGKKPIDIGIGNGKPPLIDPGFGKKPIDIGIGNGKGNGGIKIDPGLIGKIKTPMLPFNPGIKIPVPGKPKIPICPPFPFPHKPHHCLPCPPVYLGWCWFPGWWGGCYGYAGGMGLPMLTTPMVAQLPPVEVLANGSLPQIVPGTTVAANVMGMEAGGRVLMQYNAVAMIAEMKGWENDKVTFVVPSVALQEPVPVKLIFLRANGEVAQEVNAELVAPNVEPQPQA